MTPRKTKIISGFLGLVLFSSLVFSPPTAHAQSISDLMAIIRVLQAQIAALQAQLANQRLGTASFQFTRNLDLGSVGPDVAVLQQRLITLGFLRLPPGVAKGTFGPLTKLALASYQKSKGILPAVGYFGPATRESLFPPVVTQAVGTPATPTTSRRGGGGGGGSNPPPATLPNPTITLTATPSTIDSGQSSLIEWSVVDATSCTASDGGGNPDWSGSMNFSDYISVILTTSTTYTLTCVNQNGPAVNRSVTVTVSGVPTPNQAPTANAGSDQSITLPVNQVSVSGSASDDGLPNPPSILTYLWSKVSGPGTVAFGNASSLFTTATFSAEGTYSLRLTVSDSVLTDTDDVTINVAADPNSGAVSVDNDECTDGLDNDSDGQTDMVDFGCYGPNYQETNTDYGFTRFTPSNDTVKVYVSSSIGNDSYTGLCGEVSGGSPVCGPKASIAAGVAVLRGGGNPDWNGYPDWLLFRRGDTWNSGIGSWSRNGRSSTERMLISSYGPSTERPLFKIGGGVGLYGTDKHDLAISGLKFYASTRDPNSADWVSGAPATTDGNGIKFIFANRNILIEDNFLSHTLGIVVQSSNATPDNCWANMDNIEIRRNVISNSFHADVHDQGIFTDGGNNLPSVCAGGPQPGGSLLVEGNVLYHNGWYNASNPHNYSRAATIYNRNAYFAHGWGNTIVKDNITAEGASGGLQLRMGGQIINNLLLKEPEGFSFGHPENIGNVAVGGIVKNNVILGSRDIVSSSSEPRGAGFGFGSIQSVVTVANAFPQAGSSLIQNLTVNNNIVAHNELGSNSIFGLNLDSVAGGAFSNVDVYDNIIYNWKRPTWSSSSNTQACALYLDVAPGSTGVNIHDNSFQQPNGEFAVCSTAAPSNTTLSGNSYFSSGSNSSGADSGDTGTGNGWFSVAGANKSTTDWTSQMSDSNPNFSQVTYPDPDRSIETYMDSLGLTPTYNAFIQQTLLQSRHNWRNAFTADAVNDYIRAGFNMDQAMDTTSERNLATAHSSGQNILTRFFIAVGREVLGFARWFFGLFY